MNQTVPVGLLSTCKASAQKIIQCVHFCILRVTAGMTTKKRSEGMAGPRCAPLEMKNMLELLAFDTFDSLDRCAEPGPSQRVGRRADAQRVSGNLVCLRET